MASGVLKSWFFQFNCLAHARRKFSETLTNDKLRAEHVLAEIQKLYAIEIRQKFHQGIIR